MSEGLTHIDEHGRAQMVDVTGKPPTRRTAEARCVVRTGADVAAALAAQPDGTDLIEMARFSGVLAAKQTSSLIPLCHPIPIERVTVEITVVPDGFGVAATAEITQRTGVEMEALTACAGAALTLAQGFVDVDPRVTIGELTLWHKSGGRSGAWHRSAAGEMQGDGRGARCGGASGDVRGGR
ncbi:MAG TPA: cyclic pyranopterin monophosphate synthase MoaC [Acidimicrobiales bacterium]|jgi:cyclic pyranopterin phosphate synthase